VVWLGAMAVNQCLDTIAPSETPTEAETNGLAASLIGIAKTDAPPTTDAEVKAMLDAAVSAKVSAIAKALYWIPMFYCFSSQELRNQSL
jgi:hypothetical protein